MDPLILSLVIGGGLLLAARRKKKRSYTAPTPQPLPGPVPTPAGSDQKLLMALGYGSDKASISAFQADFNVVQKAFAIWDRFLTVDGIVGKNTRGALSRSVDYVNGSADKWQVVLEDATAKNKQQGKDSGLTANDKGNLESLGYKIDAGVVQRFQKHFNAVNTWWLADNGEALLPMTLAEDNLMGPNTREAIAAAQDAQNNIQTPWGQLVAEATGQS